MKTSSWTVEGATLHVTGHIWQGNKTSHEYSLHGKSHPKNLREAKSIAGDFSELTSASVVVTKREVTESVTTKHLKQ